MQTRYSEKTIPAHAGIPALETASNTVLIVEDDPGLQMVIAELFSTMGYISLTASDAAEALKSLTMHPEVALLFSDVVMPGGMDGIELAAEVRSTHPTLKILLASGYPQKELGPKSLDENMGFISKPYRWSELAESLKGLGL
jgi:CheY-like chemotaxis protein